MMALNTVDLLKKITLLFLLLSASLLPTSSPGRQSRFAKNLAEVDDEGTNNSYDEVRVEGEVVKMVLEEKHERLLRANARDYGRYDPAPGLREPPSKLIPRG